MHLDSLTKPFGLLALIAIVSASSCVPKRIHWSPDGQQALILTDNKTWLTTADGSLSESPSAVFEYVAWFPDSRRFVGVRQESLSTWAEVKPHLAAEQISTIVQLAPEFREQILEHTGSFDGWTPKLGRSVSATELVAMWIYAREQDPQALREKLGDEWQKLGGFSLTLRVLQIGEIRQGKIELGRVLVQTLDDFGSDSLHVSPDGTKLAYVIANVYPPQASGESEIRTPSDAGGTLVLLELEDPAQPRTVASFAAWRSDFTPDSRSLVYATTRPIPEGKTIVLGSVERKPVDSGTDLQNLDPDHLAGVIYLPDTKIICLDDGRILFSTVNITLPMATADMSGGPSLFSLDPDRRATIAPMLTRSAEAKGLTAGFEHGLFDLRPDGGAITLIGSGDDGQVAYYVFASGQVESVAEKKGEWKLLERPAWRNNQELSLAVAAGHEWGSPNRPEVVLYSIETKQARCISRTWPDDLLNAFQPGEARTQPAGTQPSEGAEE